MLAIWFPEEIQGTGLTVGKFLTDHEIRAVLARHGGQSRKTRGTESGISSAAVMEIISNVSENRQVTVPAELAGVPDSDR